MTTVQEAKNTQIKVLDMSSFQHDSKTESTIDYDKFSEQAHKDNVHAIILKWKGGSVIKQAQAKEDYIAFKGNGFIMGVYDFFYPEYNVKLQTDFWADAPYDDDDLPVVVDVERRHLIHQGKMTATQYENAVLYAMQKTKENFGRVMLYTNLEEIRDWASKRDILKYPLMMALWKSGNRDAIYNWTDEQILYWYPTIMRIPFFDWAIHQYSGYYFNPGAQVTKYKFLGKWIPYKTNVNIDMSVTSLHKLYYLTNRLHLLSEEEVPPSPVDPPAGDFISMKEHIEAIGRTEIESKVKGAKELADAMQEFIKRSLGEL